MYIYIYIYILKAKKHMRETSTFRQVKNLDTSIVRMCISRSHSIRGPGSMYTTGLSPGPDSSGPCSFG